MLQIDRLFQLAILLFALSQGPSFAQGSDDTAEEGGMRVDCMVRLGEGIFACGEAFSSARSAVPSTSDSLLFTFPKERLDRLVQETPGGNLSATGFNVDISTMESVTCADWVGRGSAEDTRGRFNSWDALVPELQCDFWAETGDEDLRNVVPNAPVTASYNEETGALEIRLWNPDAFYGSQWKQGERCHFSVEKIAGQYGDWWLAECLSQDAAASRVETEVNPNLLFVEAIDLYKKAEGTTGREREELLQEVSEILQVLEDDHPDSKPAQFMREGKPLGPIDLAVLPATDRTDVSDDEVVPPVGGVPLEITATFFDPTYPSAWSPPKQHLGIDLAASEGEVVRSPVAGQVVLNRTNVEDAFNKYLIIRDKGGLQHVFGHVDSALVANQPVDINDPIGKIVRAGKGPHLHWGINSGDIVSTFVPYKWGFGRAPLSATEEDARAKGWLDPVEWFASRGDGGVSDETPTDGSWGPKIVSQVALGLGYAPCRDWSDARACLESKGVNEEAIEFSLRADPEGTGEVFASRFVETGTVDVGETQFIGNTVYYSPVLLNGGLGIHEVEFTQDIRIAFRDRTSQVLLSENPEASNISLVQISSHRLLESGVQRFVLLEQLLDGCRACDIVGVAVSFIEVDLSSEPVIARRPVGLVLDNSLIYEGVTSTKLMQSTQVLQLRLNSLGYDAGEMHGTLGQKTRAALMEFQADYCLPMTGQIDQATAVAIAEADGFSPPCPGERPQHNLSMASPDNPTENQFVFVSQDAGALCRNIGDQVKGKELFDLFADRKIESLNVDNYSFSEQMRSDGSISLTTDSGLNLSGLYSITQDKICYRYEGSSEACLTIHRCLSSEAPYVKVNKLGEQTALVMEPAILADLSSSERPNSQQNSNDTVEPSFSQATESTSKSLTTSGTAEIAQNAEMVFEVDSNELSECVAIDNDIARLQCFDDLAKNQIKVTETRSPEEIMSDLVYLSSHDGLRLGKQYHFSHSMDNCIFQSEEYTFHYNGNKSVQQIAEFAAKLVYLDLKQVDADKSRPKGKRSFEIVMARGAEAHKITGGHLTWGADADRFAGISDIQATFREVLVGGDPRKFLHWPAQKDSRRIMVLKMNPEEHQADAREISDLFIELVQACQKLP